MQRIITENKKRIEWLDVARGLSIFFVIFGHSGVGYTWIMQYAIPLFHLAMFFFVSGYLFKENCSFGVVFEQRTRTLLFPYLFWGTFAVFIGHILGNPPISIIDDFKGVLLLYGDYLRIWFIGALWAYSLFFYIITRMCKSNCIALGGWTLLLFVLGCLYLHHWNGPKLPYCMDKSFCAMAFMCLGLLYKKKEYLIDSFLSKKIVIFAFVVFVCAVNLFNNCREYFGCAEIYPSLLIYGLGIPIAIFIAKHWTKYNRAILFLGKNSMMFFVFHFQIGTIVGKIFGMINKDLLLFSPMISTTIKTIVIVLLTTIPVLFVNRFCPFLKGQGFKLFNRL